MEVFGSVNVLPRRLHIQVLDQRERAVDPINIHPLPLGFYTLVVEFYPPEMQNVSVHASATSASIKKQTSKTFPAVGSAAGYVKPLVQFHRWRGLPAIINYLYLNLHGVTTSSTTGRMVVYGVSGLVSNVLTTVFDQAYVVDSGRMVDRL